MSAASEANERESSRAGERANVLLAGSWHFFLMAAYFVLKPLREEMGVVSGVRSLKWLWMGTLVTSLLVLPPYWKLVSKLPRQKFIPIVNRAILVTLLVFYAAFRWLPDQQVWVARAFYVWVSVFNLFVLSVFWSFMADAFRLSQGRRLFGLVGAGGTAGALLGAWFTLQFAENLKTPGLLLGSAALLEVATWCALRLSRALPSTARTSPRVEGSTRPSLRQQWVAGVALLSRSPYLLGAAGYLFLSTFAASFLYAMRNDVVGQQLRDSTVRTEMFAWSEFATQTLALLLQTLLAARMLRKAGTGFTLSIQMAIAVAGFVLLGFVLRGDVVPLTGSAWWATLGLPLVTPSAALLAVVLFPVVLKGVEYGLSKPAREALYTVVSRDEKYQSKSLIDTGLYRFYDQVHIWTISPLREGAKPGETGLGLPLGVIAFMAAPVLLFGIPLAFWLGRRQERLAAEAPAPVPVTAPATTTTA